MNRTGFISIFLLSCALRGMAAEDTVSIQQRIIEHRTFAGDFFSRTYRNPALKQFQYEHRLTEVRFDGEYGRESEPVLVEEGDGRQIFGTGVASFIPLADASLWGDASYSNGTKYNLKMNETSDAGLLYPYLSGDTIGGNLRSETYRFSGGYARRYRSFSWGLAAAFRATQEYRAVDPRPANIASDLRVSAGFAFYPCTDYVLGGAVHLQKYKQKNEIDFYNELGDVKIFHYTGLGMDYARFRTKADRTYYIGQGAGASLNLKPRHVAGFSATMDYSYSGFEKIIASLNELNMLELADRSATAEAGYRTEGKGFFRAFRLNGYLRQRAGNENIFGNESSNNYPYIASIWQYRHRLAGVEAAALCEYRSNGNTVWEAQPAAGYDTETEQYLYPARKISFDAATLSLRLAATVTKGRCAFRTQAFVRHRMPIESSMDVSGNGNENDNYSLPALLHNFASRSGRQTLLALDERFDFAFRDNYALFLQCRWQYGEYVNRIRSNYFTFSCGINF